MNDEKGRKEKFCESLVEEIITIDESSYLYDKKEHHLKIICVLWTMKAKKKIEYVWMKSSVWKNYDKLWKT